ncbi:uncharacterized protein LOC109200448 isoform X1 [Oreochromis niloticus]|uniref:uncharacterized protein LOC109200448 isoform X1 n=1 Tax=Oreochromis niloticus TaxID=8128 RepID=UPI000DF1C47B|nr:uncharacterized protein LOC109200448 isoform X1 [Oreochromis niloticus]
MAPVCVARRLSLPLLCLFVLFFIARVNPLLMYNRQTLLDLRLVASDLTNTTYTGHKTLPPFLAGIPANLCRTLAPASRRKRFRRRGKRSGLLVKLKAYLVRSSPAPWNKRGSVPHHVFSPRSLEPIDAWLVPVDVPAAKDFPSSSSARCEPTEPAAAVSGLAVSHEHADLHQSDAVQTAPAALPRSSKKMAAVLKMISKNFAELAELMK